MGKPVESVVELRGPCGIAETENTEKSRVIETAKMVDFIWYNGRRDCSWKEYEPQVLHMLNLAAPSLYRLPPMLPSQISAGIKYRETAQHSTPLLIVYGHTDHFILTS